MKNGNAQKKSSPDSLSLMEAVVNACRDTKGKDITVLDVSNVFDLADYFVVVSGRSDRHVQGICNKISQALEQFSMTEQTIEGFDDGHWVLIDCSEVIVHVFYEPMRKHYDIEGLWLQAQRVPLPEEEPSGNRKRQAA